MSVRMAFGALVLSVLSFGRARADAIGPPPDDCPRFSIPSACHGPPFCRLDACMGSIDCDPGEDCILRELCMGTSTCGGLGGSSTVATVLGDNCTGCAGLCQSQFVCSTTGRDVGPRDAGRLDAGRDAGRLDAGRLDAGPDGPRHARYCSCAVPSAHGSTPAWVVGAALLALIGAGRRSQRRAGP